MDLNWTIKHFSDLSTRELYEIIGLRIEVFVVEQNCPYQDADRKDHTSFHVMGFDGSHQLVAYSRVLPAGISFEETSIGRVCTSAKVRKKKAGKALMEQSLLFISQKYGFVPVRIGAQCYLKQFYSGLGFHIASSEYLEDNIPHVEMLFHPVSS
jgi:ElaA protein